MARKRILAASETELARERAVRRAEAQERFRSITVAISTRTDDAEALAALSRLVKRHGSKRAAIEYALKQASPPPPPSDYAYFLAPAAKR